jgi:fructokinase
VSAPAGIPRVSVIGEALIDIVCRCDGSVDEAPGGSPANVALTLGRLGDATRLITRLGDDPHGHSLRTWLAAAGVEVVAARARQTSTAIARLDGTGAAAYEFDIDWFLDDVPLELGGVVHTGSVAAYLPPGSTHVRQTVAEARAGSLVTYDPNIRPALIASRVSVRHVVEDFVSLADAVKASDEDLRWLYPDQDPEDVARRWRRRGPSIMVVTTGAQGAFATTARGEVRVPAPRAEVVDTVGAGDTFMGALIDGLLRAGYTSAHDRDRLRAVPDVETAALLRFAAAAAAITVSRPGADPPRRCEVAATPASASVS